MTEDQIRLAIELLTKQPPAEQIEGLPSRYPGIFEVPRVDEIPDPLKMRSRMAGAERRRKQREEAEFQTQYGRKTLAQMARPEFVPDDISASLKAMGTLGSGVTAGVKSMIGEAFGMDPGAIMQRNIYLPKLLEKARSGEPLTAEEERELAFYDRYINKGMQALETVGNALSPVWQAYADSKIDALAFMPGLRNVSMIDDLIDMSVRGARQAAPVVKSVAQQATQKAAGAVDRAPFRADLLPLYASPQFVTRGADKAKDLVKDVTQAVKSELETAPVGAVQLQTPTVPVSELNFYSPAQQAVVNLKQQKGTGNQFLAQISKTPGVKPAELEWTGLADFLKSRGEQPVTKQEINNYLRNNKVQVSEKIMVSPEARTKMINDALPFNYSLLPDGTYHDYISDTYFYQHELPDEIRDDIRMITDNVSEAEYGHGDLVLPGGENYREILLTLPEKQSSYGKFLEYVNEKYGKRTPRSEWADEDNATYEKLVREAAIAGDPNFKSSHYLEPNIVSHMRVNDRVDADGNKVLFVEEIQSDWAQERRKNMRMAEESESEMVREGAERKTPSAPFVTNTEDWVNLSLKRLITEAVNKGYDRVAFINGTQSADRYDLSKQVDSIVYLKENDGTYSLVAIKDGRELVKRDNVAQSALPDLVGKEVADRMATSEGQAIPGGPERELSGENLRVGGEGMKKFYDEIVPNTANKLLKKLGGGKLEEIIIPTGKGDFDIYDLQDATPEELAQLESGGMFNKQLGFTITPEMKSLVRQGLPLFAKGGHVSFESKNNNPPGTELDQIRKRLQELKNKPMPENLAEINRLMAEEIRLENLLNEQQGTNKFYSDVRPYMEDLNEAMRSTIEMYRLGKATEKDVQQFVPLSEWEISNLYGQTDVSGNKPFEIAPPSLQKLDDYIELEEPASRLKKPGGFDPFPYAPSGPGELRRELNVKKGGDIRSFSTGGLGLLGRVAKSTQQAGKAAKKASDAKRREQRVQANLEAYMGSKDKPKTYYHATEANKDFEVFDLERRPHPKSAKAVFLTPSTDWANQWLSADMSMLEKTGVPKPRIMPLITRVKNTFDYENPGHITQLMNQAELPPGINREHVADMLSEGNWNFIEDRRIQKAIRDLGFDSFNVSEKGTKNLGVFDIHDVKALFNRGSYDPNEPSISKAKGGLACL